MEAVTSRISDVRPDSLRMTGGQAVVKALELHGVEAVFGISGVHTLALHDALMDSRQITSYTVRHEQGAGFAADGYARATGKVGVCTLITGPGLTNAATPIAQAYSDSVPMLVITSSNHSAKFGRWRGQLHELKNQTGVGESICDYSRLVTRVEEIPAALAEAFQHMASRAPRPVHIDIPNDILHATGDVQLVPPLPAEPPAPAAETLAQAAAMLRAARNPLMIAGGGCQNSAAQVQALAERLGCAVILTCNGKGVLPDAHPQVLPARFRSFPGLFDVVRKADLVLLLGTDLSEQDTGGKPLAAGGPVIHVELDPDRIGANLSTDLPVTADVGRTASALLEALGSYPVDPGRLEAIRAVRREMDAIDDATADIYQTILHTLERSLAPDAILVNDMTQVSYRAVQFYPVQGPRQFMFPRGLGTLGFSLPVAIGAKIGRPDRQVVSLSGDGGFQFTLPEIATAVQYGLSLPIIVCNNDNYWTVKLAHERTYGRYTGCDLVNPDFVALAHAYKMRGVRLADVARDLPGALAEAFAAHGPTLIEIPV